MVANCLCCNDGAGIGCTARKKTLEREKGNGSAYLPQLVERCVVCWSKTEPYISAFPLLSRPVFVESNPSLSSMAVKAALSD